MDIQVSSDDLEIIVKILRNHFPSASFFVFGSRVSNKAEQYSDFDIAINNQHPLKLSELSLVKEKFAESNLKFSMDITDFQSVSQDFKNHILENSIKLPF